MAPHVRAQQRGQRPQDPPQEDPPVPHGARMVYVWLRGSPDVVRMVATDESAVRAERDWEAFMDCAADAPRKLVFESQPSGNGRRQRLVLCAPDVQALAVDRPTVMAALAEPRG